MRTALVRSEYPFCIVPIAKVTAAKVDTVNAPCGSKQTVEDLEVYGFRPVRKPPNSSTRPMCRDIKDSLADARLTAAKVSEPMTQLLRLIKRFCEDADGTVAVAGQRLHKGNEGRPSKALLVQGFSSTRIVRGITSPPYIQSYVCPWRAKNKG